MITTTVEFKNKKFNVVSLVESGQMWFLADPFTKVLGYSNSIRIGKHVSQHNQRYLEDLESIQNRPTRPTSKNIGPQSKFINRAGLFELIEASMPKTKEFRDWVNSYLLVKLGNTGEHSKRNDAPVEPAPAALSTFNVSTPAPGSNAQWLRDVEEKYEMKLEMCRMTLKMEHNEEITKLKSEHKDAIMASKEEITKLKADLAVVQAEGRANYERQIQEYVRREGEMRAELNELKRMRQVGNITLMDFGMHALLAKDNIAQNDEMRANIERVSNRIIPEMASQPNKVHYACAYEYKLNGWPTVRVTRDQRERVDMRDKIMREYGANPAKRFKPSKQFDWVYGAEKFAEFVCPNPISLWVKIRDLYPHRCYGFRFVNKAKTALQTLNEEEVRDKYRNDVKLCERTRRAKKAVEFVEKFKALGLKDEEDAVARCYTNVLDVRPTIIEVLKGLIDSLRDELKPKEGPRRYENFCEVYTPAQLHNSVTNYNRNYVTINNNLNFFNSPPPSSWVSSNDSENRTAATEANVLAGCSGTASGFMLEK